MESRPRRMVFDLRLRRCLPVGILRILNFFSSLIVVVSVGHYSRKNN